MKKFVALVEIPALDFDRTVQFYNSLFDVELKGYDSPEERMAFFPGGEVAISMAKGFLPSSDGTLLSLNTGTELDAILKKVVSQGGKILTPKTKIESDTKGSFAIIKDCEGNRVGLYGDPE